MKPPYERRSVDSYDVPNQWIGCDAFYCPSFKSQTMGWWLDSWCKTTTDIIAIRVEVSGVMTMSMMFPWVFEVEWWVNWWSTNCFILCNPVKPGSHRQPCQLSFQESWNLPEQQSEISTNQQTLPWRLVWMWLVISICSQPLLPGGQSWLILIVL